MYDVRDTITKYQPLEVVLLFECVGGLPALKCATQQELMSALAAVT